MLKVAFASVPKDGGTFTFYRNVRRGLFARGIDFRCVTVGARESSLIDPSFVDEGCVVLCPAGTSIKKQSMAFTEWCIAQGVDIVFAINSEAILSALPHLPASVRVMSRCANTFDHGYRITVSSLDRIYRIVALAPVQVHQLVSRYHVNPDIIQLIPNGADSQHFAEAASLPRGTDTVLRLGFMGRLEHNQKGVLFLPAILARLEENGVPFKLSIAGQGVHGNVLANRLDRLVKKGAVEFIGVLKPDEIPGFLAQTDIFLFPSQFEGSPNALIEAIMAGCVPAAWDIAGLIDYVVKDGETGVLASPGDTRALADKITWLHRHRDRLQAYSRNAADDGRKRFSIERVVDDYASLLHEVMSAPLIPWQPRPWSDFRVDPAFAQPLWRRHIPGWLKQVYRRLRHRLEVV